VSSFILNYFKLVVKVKRGLKRGINLVYTSILKKKPLRINQSGFFIKSDSVCRPF